MHYRKARIAIIAAFVAICCLAALFPPRGEPRLFYQVTIPEKIPPRITLWGAREGTMYDGHKRYADLHGDGWEDYVYEFAHPRAGPGLKPGVFSTDLEIPFRCEAYFDTKARSDGYQDCRRAVNELIWRYGLDRVRRALRQAPSRYDDRHAGRRPRSEGVRITRKPGEPLRR